MAQERWTNPRLANSRPCLSVSLICWAPRSLQLGQEREAVRGRNDYDVNVP